MSLLSQTSWQKRVLILSLLLGPGCAGTGATSTTSQHVPLRDNSPIQTDSLVYHLERRPSEYRAYATATFVNRTGSALYFMRCNRQSTTPMSNIRRTGADSTRAFFSDFAWACVGGVPAGQLLPGDSTTVRMPLGSMDQPAMQPPLKTEDLVGLMRIDFLLCSSYVADSDECHGMPQSQRTSNAFLVTY